MLNVEEFSDKQMAICTTEKRVEPLVIEKDMSGFVFFKITSTKSTVPEELTGRYTSMQKAIRAVRDWERAAGSTVAAKRKQYSEIRKSTKELKSATAENTDGS
jgi:hypothetical protein